MNNGNRKRKYLDESMGHRDVFAILRMEGKKQGILLYLKTILGFNDHYVAKNVFPEPVEIAMSPRHGIEIYWQVMSLKFVVMSNRYFQCGMFLAEAAC